MQSVMRHVLVVDDDERILAMYKRCFDGAWAVHCANTVEAAGHVAKDTPLEAAILDLHVGTSSSIPLLRTLRASNRDLRIMVVSGYLTTDTTVVTVQAGADVVVDKPIRPRDVMKRLLTARPADIDMCDTPTLEEAIESHVARVYSDCGGNVSETARRLGIYRSSLQRRLRRSTVKRIS